MALDAFFFFCRGAQHIRQHIPVQIVFVHVIVEPRFQGIDGQCGTVVAGDHDEKGVFVEIPLFAGPDCRQAVTIRKRIVDEDQVIGFVLDLLTKRKKISALSEIEPDRLSLPI